MWHTHNDRRYAYVVIIVFPTTVTKTVRNISRYTAVKIPSRSDSYLTAMCKSFTRDIYLLKTDNNGILTLHSALLPYDYTQR